LIKRNKRRQKTVANNQIAAQTILSNIGKVISKISLKIGILIFVNFATKNRSLKCKSIRSGACAIIL